MCFSPEASYGLGALLVAGGGMCVYHALKTNRKYIPMSLMPVFAGLQQIGEGAVWSGLQNDCVTATGAGSFVFLFFAWVVWPVWIPWMTRVVEPDLHHRRILTGFMVLAAIWGGGMYLPYLWNPAWVDVAVVGHSIGYKHFVLWQNYIPVDVVYFVYLTLIGVAPVVSSHIHVKLFGLALISSTLIVYAFYTYAITSVLCFFAAALTAYLFFIVCKDKCGLGRQKD